jgi:hypothetical protein
MKADPQAEQAAAERGGSDYFSALKGQDFRRATRPMQEIRGL